MSERCSKILGTQSINCYVELRHFQVHNKSRFMSHVCFLKKLPIKRANVRRKGKNEYRKEERARQ